MFDKAFHRYERKFKRGQMLDIEEVCTSNPTEFWDHMKRLGPKTKSSIPMEVYGPDDEILCDTTNVMNVWQQGFQNIYNEGYEESFNSNWGREVRATLDIREREMSGMHGSSEILNENISIDEVRKIIQLAKC